MVNNYSYNATSYVPTYSRRNMWGEEIDHRKDPSEVFDNAVQRFCQDLIDDMFRNAMDIYCASELLRGCLSKETIDALKKHADEISEILKVHTSDRGIDYYYMPLDHRH